MSTSVDGPLELFEAAFDVDVTRTAVVVVMMLGLDAVWWVALFDGHVPMPGMAWLMEQGVPAAAPGAMELGVFHVGTLEAVLGYTVMWGVMMWAMMHPAMTRFARDYADAHQGSALEATTALAGFLTTYHLVWALSAVIPLSVHAVLPGGVYGFTRSNPHLVVGGVLVLAGLFQLSAPKRGLLRSCCAAVEDHTDGLLDGFRHGVDHGVECVVICFGLFFLVMPFFGEMNFFWMVVLTAVVTMERIPTWGEEISAATGVVSLVAGVVVLVVRPALPVAFEAVTSM
ncbi:DUF2182 domain-containing protein [Halomarina oriensis]|uniref:DUF2182 domain-containing protein n=1 Tax=Halomarina oriensis TaxID=671145 RepID=A0A6B0GNG5_9EURY|nr:DUF2182 domain-containing protein [Halomarina oriensis]MWG35049.1 DUF2182 domain-containing protein [Halomarina oriensis]